MDPDPNETGKETPEESWMDNYEFDDDTKKALSKYGSEEAAHKGHVEAQQMIGNSIRLPKDDASDEDKQKATAEILTKLGLGKPDSPDGYEIKRPKMPEGMSYDEQAEKEFRVAAHAAGYTNKQVQEAIDFQHNLMAKIHKTITEEAEKRAKTAVKELRKLWGDKADGKLGKKGNPGTLQRTIMHISKELELTYTNDKGEVCSKLADCLDDTALGDRVPLCRAFDWVYTKLLAEGETITGEAATSTKESDFFDYSSMDKEESSI